MWVIWGNQVVILSSQPELISQNWLSGLELVFVHFISRSHRFPGKMIPIWIGLWFLLGYGKAPFGSASANSHIELGQVSVWGNAGKRGTFTFIQKSKIKASQLPGDFSVVPTSLPLFLCQIFHPADSLAQAQPMLTLPGEQGEATLNLALCGPCLVTQG